MDEILKLSEGDSVNGVPVQISNSMILLMISLTGRSDAKRLAALRQARYADSWLLLNRDAALVCKPVQKPDLYHQKHYHCFVPLPAKSPQISGAN